MKPETKATCDAIEALHDDEMCSWYMGIDGKYPDDMAAIDLKTLARDYQAVCAERDRLTNLCATLQQEAEIHAQEARTQKATVHEIYQLCSGNKGERGDWHGAEPVREIVAERDRHRTALGHYADETNWECPEPHGRRESNFHADCSMLQYIPTDESVQHGYDIAQAALQGETNA